MLLATLLALAGQTPDTLRADTTRATRLGDVTVTVTRTPESLARVPAAASVVDRNGIGGSRALLGLDEALNGVPGVYISNRYNFSLDQRVTIRGFGSRAPFGTRGVKILLDGIPQTTPDGQSQFTNIELGTIDRIEVLRGSASSLYGNAAGGAILLRSALPPVDGLSTTARVEAGSFGLLKWQVSTAGRSGRLGGTLSLARTTWDGFRRQSEVDARQLNSSLHYQAGERTTLTLRVNAGDVPQAQNPGALTFAEYAANPDSTVPTNITRGADKDSRQIQGGLTFRHLSQGGHDTEATVFAYQRVLENPIATPQQPVTPDGGTYIQLNRDVAGLRVSHGRRLAGSLTAPRLVAGLDAQRMADDRRNWRSLGGERTDALLVDQLEEVEQVGPFAQVVWTPNDRVSLSGGTRYDWFRFTATDRFLEDGEDNSGERTMNAWSGSAGVSYVLSTALIPYLHVATSFETPTTTELSIRPGDSGGFSSDLEPQRATNIELGGRGEAGSFSWSAAVFRIGIENAIVQWREIGGRAYFRNAGGITNVGAEFGAGWSPTATVRFDGTYTWARYRFSDYRIEQGENVEVLDDNALPGLPAHFARLTLSVRPVESLDVAVEHTMSGALWTDDQNTEERRAESWGAGVTNVRVLWASGIGRVGVRPFGAINNLWGRRYVSSAIINGAGGRVLEPAPGRNFYVGFEVRKGR
jgi:iron complex outermembrane recepter protein